MRKILSKMMLLIILCMVAINFGCSKTLDLMPRSTTEALYFSTEGEYTRAVLGIYAKMTDLYGRVVLYNGNSGPNTTLMPIYLLPGDDITTNNGTEEFEIFGSLQASSDRVKNFYVTIYQMIARANVVLEKLSKESGVYSTAGLKNAHEGEALFLRGFGHYYLWNYYGTAPLNISRVESSDQLKPNGTTGTQLLDQAIADFTKAATLLPSSWDPSNRGRVTKNAAFGFLGKSLVFRGSATKNTADFTLANTAFSSITGLSLTSKFDDNFALDTENNSESLFEFQASSAVGGNNLWLPNDFDNVIGNLTCDWNYYNGDELYGTSKFFATAKLLNSFEAGDPRRNLTLDASDRSITKYVNRNGKVDGWQVSSVDNYRLLRLADVKLLKAEAILQSGGSTSDAIGLINEIRTRARAMNPGGTIPANYAVSESNKTTIMDWIMKERLIELAGEGQRWLDVRRWQMQGILTVDNTFFSSNVSGVSFQSPKHLVFPIPTAETDVNPNVKQNTGY